MREIEKQIDGLKAEIQKGLLTVDEKNKVIEQLKKEIVERESKYNNLTDQFNKKQAQLKDYLTDLEKERQLKREAQKDLKQYQEQIDNFQLLLKSGEMSQDEQKKKISELAKRIA
jgi:chromosome segregation ATPase